MVDRDGYRGVGRPSFNVKTIRINSYFSPIFCVKFLFFSYFFTLEIPIFLFFDLGSRLTPCNWGESLSDGLPLARLKAHEQNFKQIRILKFETNLTLIRVKPVKTFECCDMIAPLQC